MQSSSIDWKTWQPNMLSSLVFILKDNEVLLIRKKTGLGAGKVNAQGRALASFFVTRLVALPFPFHYPSVMLVKLG